MQVANRKLQLGFSEQTPIICWNWLFSFRKLKKEILSRTNGLQLVVFSSQSWAASTVHLSATNRRKAKAGSAGSRGCSSPRRRCPSWRDASGSSATCPPRSESSWPTSSSSPPPRLKSGSRTGGTSVSVKDRTSPWNWRVIPRPRGGWRCRCWCGTGSCAAQVVTRAPITWRWDTITPCLDVETAACTAAVITACHRPPRTCPITSCLMARGAATGPSATDTSRLRYRALEAGDQSCLYNRN